MPMKFNVGVSRNVALPELYSVGTSCNLELEPDEALLERDFDGFHPQMGGANLASDQAVHDEGERLQVLADCMAEVPAWTSGRGSVNNWSDIESRKCHSRRNQEAPSRGRKRARPNQVKAILAIARSQKADLEGLLCQEFDAERPEDLTVKQASNLIDLLKNWERT